jgi:hypothetical protein
MELSGRARGSHAIVASRRAVQAVVAGGSRGAAQAVDPARQLARGVHISLPLTRFDPAETPAPIIPRRMALA